MTSPAISALYENVVEAVALDGQEMITARAQMGQTVKCYTLAETTTYERLSQTLLSLAYNIDSDDFWEILGIPKFEGPRPTSDYIERRFQGASLLTSFAKPAVWTQEDFAKIAPLRALFGQARAAVIEELPKVLSELKRVKGGATSIPLHMEVSPELLVDLAKGGGVVASDKKKISFLYFLLS